MITTPEQMREAAARDNDLIRRGDAFEAVEVCTCGDCYTDTYRAIRAIPIAPQPAAVTVKPLVWESVGNWKKAQSFGAVFFVEQGTDTSKMEARHIELVMSALTIHPADPLSDPRVKALVEALKTTRDRLASLAHDQFDGVWSASDFEDETREADAALRAIGGEA